MRPKSLREYGSILSRIRDLFELQRKAKAKAEDRAEAAGLAIAYLKIFSLPHL
jgi:hypothetical protein